MLDQYTLTASVCLVSRLAVVPGCLPGPALACGADQQSSSAQARGTSVELTIREYMG
jgi:hypothetical protein